MPVFLNDFLTAFERSFPVRVYRDRDAVRFKCINLYEHFYRDQSFYQQLC